MKFEWDAKKNKSNITKHRISFEEAKTVFSDSSAVLYSDPDSNDEDRFLLIGFSVSLRILVICHCYREDEDTARIISARKATKREEQNYGRSI